MVPLIAVRTLLATLAVLQARVENVGIEELGTQPGLVGKMVAVDARIDRVDYQKDWGWNQLRLQGSPVLFRLPDRLAFSSPPSQKAARVQGLLREDGGQRVVDVTAIELFRSDLDRLEQGLAALAPRGLPKPETPGLAGRNRGPNSMTIPRCDLGRGNWPATPSGSRRIVPMRSRPRIARSNWPVRPATAMFPLRSRRRSSTEPCDNDCRRSRTPTRRTNW